MSLFARLEARLSPPPDPGRVAFLRSQPFAHRGLHGGDIAENSRAAFEAAIRAGHGMECDVQMSEDDVPFVFHDDALDRMTGEAGTVADRSAAILDRIMLTGTDECLPRLTDVLTLIGGRAPLLIEIKAEGSHITGLCYAVRRALEGYTGKVAIMSFNPLISGWFATHARHIVRGLVVSEENKAGLRGRIERTTSLWVGKPEFLAYDIRDLPSPFATRARARGLPVLTWTVANAAQEQVAMREADQIIYEKVGNG
ncbi:glycerophosphodiester phosphodiesterase family protein [Rhizorhapis sp. SPR117]|uniref:glycerophosphodiester phosphodiesterase family protein n=1 Tax=Rhizorhapis sp. SPR117 TaxID=2912611 RepID=UPI001F16A521|nr:glycerophosphodiester phosphodiesterase [Rhizorhapis sp. SPR117]